MIKLLKTEVMLFVEHCKQEIKKAQDAVCVEASHGLPLTTYDPLVQMEIRKIQAYSIVLNDVLQQLEDPTENEIAALADRTQEETSLVRSLLKWAKYHVGVLREPKRPTRWSAPHVAGQIQAFSRVIVKLESELLSESGKAGAKAGEALKLNLPPGATIGPTLEKKDG